MSIRLLTSIEQFKNHKPSWLECNINENKQKKLKAMKLSLFKNEDEKGEQKKKKVVLAKQPDDLIVIR